MRPTVLSRKRLFASISRTLVCVAGCGALAAPAPAQVANDWLPDEGSFCNPSNWSLGVVPNNSHHAFLGRFGAPYPYVELDCPISVGSVSVLDGAWLFTENQQLFVMDEANVSGTITWITVSELANSPHLPGLYANKLNLTSGGGLIMLENSRVNVYDTVAMYPGQLRGTGILNIIDGSDRPAFILNGFLESQDGDLTINLYDDARFDLGGNPNNNIRATWDNCNLTLNGRITQNDPFSGEVRIYRGNTLTMTDAFQISGLMRMRLGYLEQPSRFAGAGIEFLNGGTLLHESGVASIQGPYARWTTGSTLQVDPSTIMSIGASEFAFIESTATVNGYMQVFGDSHYQTSTISGSGILRQIGDAEIFGNVAINLPGGTFDMDGSSESTAITVNAGSHLSVTAGAIDFNAPNRFDGTLVNRGLLTINTPQPWTLGGELVLENDIAPTSARLQGSPLILASGSSVHAMPGGADLDVPLTVHAGAHIDGTGPGAINLLQPSTWYGGVVNGTKELRPYGSMLFDGGTTEINASAFAWDNASSVITSDAHLIVRSPNFALDTSYGHAGDLTVQGHLTVDRGSPWTFAGTMHLTSGRIDGDEVRFWNGGKVFLHGIHSPSEVDAPVWIFGSNTVQTDGATVLKLNGPTNFEGVNAATPLVTGLGTLVQNGDLTVRSDTMLNIPTYDFDGDGETPSNCVIEEGASLHLIGTSIDIDGNNVHRGHITIHDGGELHINVDGSSWNLDGTLTLQSDLTSTNPATVSGMPTYLTGRIEGTGTFSEYVFSAGTFAPGVGDDYGILTFANDTTTLSTPAKTEIKIGGPVPGESHDQVRMLLGANPSMQTMHLRGMLIVSLAEGYMPQIGQEFVIVEAPFIVPGFHVIVAPGFEVRYEYNELPELDRVIATYIGTGTCPGDIAPTGGDGVVNVGDLLAMLGEWGVCEAADDCPADLSGDGTVNVADLLALLGVWGPCPQ